ncbi:hypothetical protein MANES_02G163600v8 [Manihot esculenta]|uniref:Uncharacterized protein n=1 Tax=Manihot esculenta TaxID=3983 RepID=A0A2C9WET8_MANES|nr:hypothetical protein MANES_02G163600v8 [Manihot esculenta]
MILWFVSLWFEILHENRRELLWIIAGTCFFRIANWAAVQFSSPDQYCILKQTNAGQIAKCLEGVRDFVVVSTASVIVKVEYESCLKGWFSWVACCII